LIQALGDENWSVRHAAAQALDSRGISWGWLITEKIFKGQVLNQQEIAQLNDLRVMNPLIKALADNDSDVQEAAAKVLAALGDPQIVDQLLRLIRNNDIRLREGAARALGRLKDLRAVEPLIRALEDENWGVRFAAARALEKLKDPRAVEPLIQALGDEDWGVRFATARGLGRLKDPRAVEPLIRALGDADESVHLAAAWALGQLKDPRAAKPLKKAWQEGGTSFRKVVQQALDKIAQAGADWFRLEPVPLCRSCLCRFTELSLKLSFWQRYRFYGCRQCWGASFALQGVQRVALVLDRRLSAPKEPFVPQEEVLYVFWFPNRPLADLDEFLVGEHEYVDLQEFYQSWAQRADAWRRARLRVVPARVLAGVELSPEEESLLTRWFSRLEPLPPAEAEKLFALRR
ncbi:MAG: HEAT repeat domain-containing protein, partial [Deltaproteobacteria bacterium]|nr:HEAT repeat domain-containing protein [Deltaproteobacteria bacterium]